MKPHSKILGYVLFLCYCFFAGSFGNIIYRYLAPSPAVTGKKVSSADHKCIAAKKASQAQWPLKVKYMGSEPCFLPERYSTGIGVLHFKTMYSELPSDPDVVLDLAASLALRGPPVA